MVDVVSYVRLQACGAIVMLSASNWETWKLWLYAIWVSGVVVLVQSMFAALLAGLPVCTFPFVLTTWVAISGLNARHPTDKFVASSSDEKGSAGASAGAVLLMSVGIGTNLPMERQAVFEL
jgi:hypothetical protein